MAAARQPLLEDGGAQAASLGAILREPTPAHRAADRNDVAALREMPAKAHRQAFCGVLPLHAAAAHNALSSLDFFLSEAKLSIETPDAEGRAPLTHAAVGKGEEAIVWLARRGAPLEQRDQRGSTAAHWAATRGSTSILALLGHLGADLEARDGQGRTPAALATAGSHLETVEYLVLTRGCSEEARRGALAVVPPGPCSFWLRRCLEEGLGCHEKASGLAIFQDPTFGGWKLPLASRVCRGPEQVHVGPKNISVFSGYLAIGIACVLFVHESSTFIRLLLLASLIFTGLGSTYFLRASWSSPGCIDNTQKSLKARYEAALNHASSITVKDAGWNSSNYWGEHGPMIHQLSIVGPLRSKYCNARRECVPMFDHYCAFLRNSVGEGNYAFFFATTVWSTASCLCLTSAAVLIAQMEPGGWFWVALCTAVYFGAFALLWIMLTTYHLNLARHGLTTWEMIQLTRKAPIYLLNEAGTYSNPYSRGFWRNLLARLVAEGDSRTYANGSEDAAEAEEATAEV